MTPLQQIRHCLNYIQANPNARYPSGWKEEVIAEARKLGLLKPAAPQIGCNCPTTPRFEPVYGGDLEDVF